MRPLQACQTHSWCQVSPSSSQQILFKTQTLKFFKTKWDLWKNQIQHNSREIYFNRIMRIGWGESRTSSRKTIWKRRNSHKCFSRKRKGEKVSTLKSRFKLRNSFSSPFHRMRNSPSHRKIWIKRRGLYWCQLMARAIISRWLMIRGFLRRWSRVLKAFQSIKKSSQYNLRSLRRIQSP